MPLLRWFLRKSVIKSW